MTFIISIIFLILIIALGAPIAFALAAVGAVGLLYISGYDALVGVLQSTPLTSTNSYELLTVPMFLLMAEFVIISGVADELFESLAIWMGRVRGGLAMATALAGAGFGAISGSSTASAATLSATTIPAMLKRQYAPELASGVVAISGTLAMLIPPSIALILYGIIAEVNIGKLLIAGVIPGLVVTLGIISTVYILVKINPTAAPRNRSYTIREKLRSLKIVWPMLALFILVTGTIYTGVATPTEASALGAFGSFILALVSKKKMNNYAGYLSALSKAARTTSMLILIIMCASIYGYFITMTQSTQSLVAWVEGMHLPNHVVLFFILLLFFALGFIMDQVAILILVVPIVLPLVKSMNFDTVWFGVIVIILAEIGLVTPPVGLNVFVVSRFSGQPIVKVFKGVIPHIYAHLIMVVLFVMFPNIILWLPNSMK